MTLLDNLGTSISGLAWGSIWNIVFIVVIFLIVILIIAAVWVFMWWRTFNYSVKIYEPRGQIFLTEEEMYNLYKGGSPER